MYKIVQNAKKMILPAILSGVLFTGCIRQEPEPPKSMEKLHEENGVPVKVVNVKKENLSAGLNYFSKVRGFVEATEGVAVGDEILKINAKVGDWVNKGDVIVEFPMDSPSMQYEQAQIQLATVTATYNRAKRLLEIGEFSQQKFDEIEMQYKLAQRGVESLEKFLKVEAPISGYIVSLPAKEGDLLAMKAPLFTVAKIDKMIAKISVADSEISQIKKGMKADGYWQGHKFSGRVTEVSIAKDPYTQAFPVEVTFNNPKKELRPGTTLEIVLNTMHKDSVIAVPESAIVEEGGKSNIYVARGDKAVLVEVKPGISAGSQVEILEGLKEGDKMINCCFNLLENGKKIQIVK
jgi:RND family efflux transporter MFP subunit